jgi:3-isopropylmalate/(R)-2-methylmalate dehydratase small subunit
MLIRGRAKVIDRDHVSTDLIFPGPYVNLTDAAEIASHALEGLDPDLPQALRSVEILVTGENFGCGSSREQAVRALTGLGLNAVVVGSAARIWYRNAINLGLPVITCPGAAKQIGDGDELEIDCAAGEIRDLSRTVRLQGEPLPEFILGMLASGGLRQLIRNRTRD